MSDVGWGTAAWVTGAGAGIAADGCGCWPHMVAMVVAVGCAGGGGDSTGLAAMGWSCCCWCCWRSFPNVVPMLKSQPPPTPPPCIQSSSSLLAAALPLPPLSSSCSQSDTPPVLSPNRLLGMGERGPSSSSPAPRTMSFAGEAGLSVAGSANSSWPTSHPDASMSSPPASMPNRSSTLALSLSPWPVCSGWPPSTPVVPFSRGRLGWGAMAVTGTSSPGAPIALPWSGGGPPKRSPTVRSGDI
mmetsp:Transcript_51887/g.130353  ORF Transcript_51887/g.130353 Transcript_51887/m.130353 type:complete len:243 (-) Transcript_51887:1432-2160(-)